MQILAIPSLLSFHKTHEDVPGTDEWGFAVIPPVITYSSERMYFSLCSFLWYVWALSRSVACFLLDPEYHSWGSAIGSRFPSCERNPGRSRRFPLRGELSPAVFLCVFLLHSCLCFRGRSFVTIASRKVEPMLASFFFLLVSFHYCLYSETWDSDRKDEILKRRRHVVGGSSALCLFPSVFGFRSAASSSSRDKL